MFEDGLQLILEIFLSQQFQPVPAYSPQDSVHHPRGKYSIRCVQNGTQRSHQQYQPASHPALGKCLRVPCKKPDRPHRGQPEKTALDSPIDFRALSRLLVYGCQFTYRRDSYETATHCNQLERKGEEISKMARRV